MRGLVVSELFFLCTSSSNHVKVGKSVCMYRANFPGNNATLPIYHTIYVDNLTCASLRGATIHDVALSEPQGGIGVETTIFFLMLWSNRVTNTEAL